MATVAHAPERSYVQRMEALALANDTRTYRAKVKRDLAGGRRRAWDVIRSDHPLLQTMQVYDVLLAVPKMGRTKLSRAFVRAKVSTSKTIGGIHERQLEALAAQLGEWPSARSAIFG